MTDRGALKFKRYLGDGVYVGFDGHQLWLWTDRFGVEHEIALDASTYSALHFYWIDLAASIARKEPEREEI
jgi:hypothetical protein